MKKIYLFNKSLLNQSIIVYYNAEMERLQILSENKGKTGIYLWTHKESGKLYVGSAVDLSRRLKDYYSPSNLKRRDNYIARALISHGHTAFSLTILEYIDITNLSKDETKTLIYSKEQYYFDLLLPVYNIQKIAGSSLGQKRSEKSKEKMRRPKSVETKLKISEALKGNTHSKVTKAKMSLLKIGEKNPNFGKVHTVESRTKISIARGTPIFIYLLDGTLEHTFPSVSVTGKFLKAQNKTISKYVKSGEILREKWILSLFKK